MPATVIVDKRPVSEIGLDGHEIESPEAKRLKPTVAPLHPTHPHYLLEHLIRDVLPRKCQKQKVKDYYKEQLDDPDTAIAVCKSLLGDWVLEYWNAAKLDKLVHLKKKAATTFPVHGIVYTAFLVVEGELWRYVGQAEKGHQRITEQHQNEPYRNSHFSFFYFLWARASEVFFVLPVDNVDLKAGPILNIMEQWVALIFRGLQPSEMKDNFSPDTMKWINVKDLQRGAGIREPLAQWFGFGDFPSCGDSLKWSQDMLKREYYDAKRLQQVVDKKETLLEGGIFAGSFWNHFRWGQPTDYRFWVLNNSFEVGRADVDRFEEETIRVHCDLKPAGERHPQTVIRGMYSPPKYSDPALRLGIKISGIRKADQKEAALWVRKEGDFDLWVPRINRLVDWLEDRNLEELRPRRWYPLQLGKMKGVFTRHPVDVGDEWTKFLTFEEFEASNLRHQHTGTQPN
ncbi:hypothetical protein NX059_006880 [Plenodomus lindquistii]|nr:hypothetical protein NX059_006880 [Plenodomus lindquistii]